jgi:hypothetical protein
LLTTKREIVEARRILRDHDGDPRDVIVVSNRPLTFERHCDAILERRLHRCSRGGSSELCMRLGRRESAELYDEAHVEARAAFAVEIGVVRCLDDVQTELVEESGETGDQARTIGTREQDRGAAHRLSEGNLNCQPPHRHLWRSRRPHRPRLRLRSQRRGLAEAASCSPYHA